MYVFPTYNIVNFVINLTFLTALPHHHCLSFSVPAFQPSATHYFSLCFPAV